MSVALNDAKIHVDESHARAGPVPNAMGDFDVGAMLMVALEHDPAGCAYRFDGAQLSRSQLRDETIACAARLRDVGLQPGALVAIEIEHSFELTVAMAAVQVVGACAVPIDTAISANRRDAILDDVRPDFILRRAAAQTTALPIRIEIDRCADQLAQQTPRDRDLAFVVYTSGSSGGPKGVMITKESYVRRMMHIVPGITITHGDTDLAWTPSSFITMIDEIFLPLLCGVPTVLANPAIRSDPRAFVDFVEQEGVTTFRITPSLLDLVLKVASADALSNLRTLICSGESTSFDLQQRVHRQLDVTFLGFYGATEAPAAAFREFNPHETDANTAICTPQPFLKLRVADDNGTEANIGDTGEIWIGGCAVARGYFRQPALTAQKFLDLDGDRWFRTGDLGRRLTGGNVEILGRSDLSEVNINGVRVNLPEIRTAILQQDAVNDAWISAVDPVVGSDPVLVAHCIVPNTTILDKRALETALTQALPASAVPRLYDLRQQFPLTANGKLDIRQLAQDATDLTQQARNRDLPPDAADMNDTSQTRDLLSLILKTAEKLLDIKGLTAQDNFFQAGGNSLLAVHFALSLSEELGVDLATTLIFNTNSFADIAQSIASGRHDAASAIRPLRTADGAAAPLLTINASGSFAALAPHLNGAYGVYNVNIFGLTNDLLDVLETVSLHDLADHLATQILQTFPQGPYRFLAYCQDGCLAVETARILQDRHGADCHLLLIDTFFQEHRTTPKMWLLRVFDFGPSYLINALKKKCINIVSRKSPAKAGAAPAALEPDAELLAKSKNDQKLSRRFTELYMTYRPSAIACPVNLFVTREWRHANLSDVQKLAGKGLVVNIIEGLHHGLFQPETVGGLASVIDETLSKDTDHR